jgi:tape measure domain-containing protein
MASLGDLMVRIGCNVDEFTGQMAKVSTIAGKTMGEVEDRLGGLASMGQGLATLGASLTAFVTLPIVGIGTAAVEAAGKLEQTQIAFAHFLGGAQQSKDYLKELYQFAATTPFQIGEVTGGAQKLMAMGFAAKEVTPMLRVLGDQLSAVGRTENMGQLILAFGEMKAKGVASMKEVRQMITDGVIPAVQYMAEALGVTEGEVMDRMKKKTIDSATAINAIIKGMVEHTGGLMQEQMASFGAQMSNVKDNMTLTLKAIGDQLLPYGKMVLSFAGDVLSSTKQMAQAFGELPEPVKVFGIALAGTAAVMGPLLVSLGGLSYALSLVAAGLAPIAAVLGVSVLALTGWAAAIGIAVAALAGLGAWIYEHWAGIRAVVVEGWSGISEIWNAAWSAITTDLKRDWDIITILAKAAFGGTGDFLGGVWDKTKTLFSQQWNEIYGVLSGVWIKTKALAIQQWDEIKQVFSSFIDLLSKIPGVTKLLNLGQTFKDAEVGAAQIAKVNEALKALGVGAKSTAFQLQTLEEKKADWAVEHKKKVADLTAQYKVLEAGVKDGKVSQDQLAEASKHLTAVTNETFHAVKEGGANTADAAKAAREAEKAAKELESAYDKLGFTSSKVRDQQAAIALIFNSVAKGALPANASATAQLTYLYQNSYITLGQFREALQRLGTEMLKNAQAIAVPLVSLAQMGESLAELKLRIERLPLSELPQRFSAMWSVFQTSFQNFNTLNKEIVSLEDAISALGFSTPKMSAQLEILNADLFNMQDRAAKAAAALHLLDLAGTITTGAFHDLGVKSQHELDELADKAQADYQIIRNSSESNTRAAADAFIRMVDLQKAAGRTLAPETLAQYEQIKHASESTTKAIGSSWIGTLHEIRNALSNDLARSFSDIIFQTGKLSDAFKRMGQDVVDIILNKIIKDGISHLLDSLASVGGLVGKIAGAFGGIATNAIGTGAQAAAGGVLGTGVGAGLGGAATGVGTTVGSGASGASGATGAIGSIAGAGISGVVGLVTGAVSAVSGVISNFQMAGMNKSLDLIEASTRYAWLTLGGQGHSIVFNTEQTMFNTSFIKDRLVEIGVRLDTVTSDLEDINANIVRLINKFASPILNLSASFNTAALERIEQQAVDYLSSINERMLNMAGGGLVPAYAGSAQLASVDNSRGGDTYNVSIGGIDFTGAPGVDKFMNEVKDTLGARGFRKGVYR